MKNTKHELTPFFMALGAISFFVAVIPILDSFSTWVCNLFGLKSVELNEKASEISSKTEQTHVNAIGFQMPDEEMEYED